MSSVTKLALITGLLIGAPGGQELLAQCGTNCQSNHSLSGSHGSCQWTRDDLYCESRYCVFTTSFCEGSGSVTFEYSCAC
jgi:hypothetical protein